MLRSFQCVKMITDFKHKIILSEDIVEWIKKVNIAGINLSFADVGWA